jgi:DNA-binding LytR/AlgR family response regulator
MNAAMTTLERYLKHERLYLAGLIAAMLFINNSINATSILMEAQRAGTSIPVSRPFINEYTSALSSLLLIPGIIWLTRRFPLGWGSLRRNGLAHFGFSIVFSIAHITLFVALRKLAFGLQGVDYTFSTNLPLSFLYEYRKDAWAYIGFLIAIYCYRFILSRLRGEAVPVGSSEDAPPGKAPERLLVRKLGKEFIVRVDDVEWLEAAGNYVNLHMGERVYPLRATMNSLIDSLSDRGFVRIHRSRGVNLDYVESLTPLESGDCTISLKSGRTVSLSRRYRDAFRTRLNQHTETAHA